MQETIYATASRRFLDPRFFGRIKISHHYCSAGMLCILFMVCAAASTGTALKPLGLGQTDGKAYATFPRVLRSMAGAGLPRDETGLLGLNREWGDMYSPRFQLGAGRTLRIALAGKTPFHARRAFWGIKAGADTIHKNGFIPTRLPETIASGRMPSAGDIAGAAAIFLGDACMGMLTLELSEKRDQIVETPERQAVNRSLQRGIVWLRTQRPVLETANRAEPNRLLVNALAFQACGTLSRNQDALQIAHTFVSRALALQTKAGYFLEGGSWDTGNQALAVSIGNNLLLTGYDKKILQPPLLAAAAWLENRVDAEGRLDSSGNQSTCEGEAHFWGEKKKLSLTDVLYAVIYTGIRENISKFIRTAQRVVHWSRKHPRMDPCYP